MASQSPLHSYVSGVGFPFETDVSAQQPKPRSAFRSKAASDLRCILAVNPDISSCGKNDIALDGEIPPHIPDFYMSDIEGNSWLLDAPDRVLKTDLASLQSAAAKVGYRYRQVSSPEIYDGYLLQNARDLLRYQGHKVPLGDRVRLLACLDEHGSLTFSDCLQVVRETQAVPALASLILQGLLAVELDSELIGPETVVRRIRS